MSCSNALDNPYTTHKHANQKSKFLSGNIALEYEPVLCKHWAIQVNFKSKNKISLHFLSYRQQEVRPPLQK